MEVVYLENQSVLLSKIGNTYLRQSLLYFKLLVDEGREESLDCKGFNINAHGIND